MELRLTACNLCELRVQHSFPIFPGRRCLPHSAMVLAQAVRPAF